MSARLLTQCALCGSESLRTVLSLGSSPPTCVMGPVGSPPATEEHHPLELLVCEDCTLAQLSVIVSPEVAFPPDYPYSSGNSRALHDNFEDLAEQARRWACPLADDLVVDIGANDGTLLSKFRSKFQHPRTVGVEPTGQAKRIAGPAYQDFFGERIAERILAEHGPATVITACNVLAHVADLGDVMRGINLLLADDGILVAENHDLASVVAGQWDTVYHEHLRFYDPHSFRVLLDMHGLAMQGCREISAHGGSFRAIADKSGLSHFTPARRSYDFEGLAETAATARDEIRQAVAILKPCGIGATARATTIINYCGLDVEDIAYVCEIAGSDKIGHFIPGTRIPVVDEARLFEDQRPAVLFSWHLADRIVPKLREQGYTGEIVLPLTSPEQLASS